MIEDDTNKYVKYFENKHRHHYYREGHMTFLKAVMRHPRVKFAFNSSIMRKNILPIIQEMFITTREEGLFSEYMFCLFDQEYSEQSKRSKQITGEKYGLIKDLKKVWESESVHNSDVKFDKHNTLLLDTDEVSVYNCHKNSLIIDSFEREDVW
jgi:hypothetical protein